MNRDWIMTLCIDSLIGQELEKHIAILRELGLNYIKVVHVTVAGSLVRQCDIARACQTCTVTRGPLSPEFRPFFDVLQLRAEHASMQIIKPAVVSRAVAGSLVRTVVAQSADDAVNFGVIGDDGAAIAECPQVLLSDKTDGRGVAQLGDPEAIAMRPDGLSIVLDYQ